ncbi:MAG TPA: polyhydroxyalkanoate depolymerase [Burkholderiaceae bacterium]|nr:polyhydroxyalkanoate depolymerase [Burkholderiaceae bacterium]
MLYQIYDTQRSLMEPFADLAQTASKIFNNPLLPFSHMPLAQRISAGYDLVYRLGKDYEKPEFGLRSVDVDGVEVAIHERVEVNKPFCELRRFKRFSDDPDTLGKLKGQPAVLIVAPLSGHYATLLRDTVKTMLKDHKVYITDWKNARLVPLSEGEFHLHDYVNYVQEFIRHLQGRYGNCHVMSVCQPTVPVLAAISLMATRGETTPYSMTMMGGPIDARKSPTAVNNLATQRSYEWFENNVIYRVPSTFPGAGRRVYPGFLQHTGFVAMNPDRHLDSHYDYFQDLIKGDKDSAEAHRKFYDEYNAVLDMDADYYLETIQTVFREFKLVNGTWDVQNPKGKLERVRPQDIKTTALLSVEGELDDISGSGQTAAAQGLCAGIPKNMRHHYEVKGAGHYGIFSGRRWREMVYPEVKQFILQHTPAPTVEKPASVAVQAAPVQPTAKKAAVPAKPVKAPAKAAVKLAPAAPPKATVAKKATPATQAAPKVTRKGAPVAAKTLAVAPTEVAPVVKAPEVKATPVKAPPVKAAAESAPAEAAAPSAVPTAVVAGNTEAVGAPVATPPAVA